VTAAVASEELTLARLRAGDEMAFRELVKRHDRAMKRIALTFVRSPRDPPARPVPADD
jgi:DNA-directed RNA polymerase specialized sigma24 family protein